MRIRDPRRFIRWGVLLAALCVVPIHSSTALAKPFSYDNYDPNNPAPPKGDGDGVVVKASSTQPLAAAMARSTTTSTTRTTTWSWFRNVLQALRLGYSFRLW